MSKTRRRVKWFVGIASVLVLPLLVLALVGWPASRHATEPSRLGVTRGSRAMEALLDTPGPLVVETLVGADWDVDRSGMINLDRPAAKAAHLDGAPMEIQIFVHALHHPTRGLFLIDTGVERAMRDDRDHAAIRGLVASAAHVDAMRFHTLTGPWLATQRDPVAGVFLTHLHLDHVSGLRDVTPGAPVYAGPGETADRAMMNVATQPSIDRALEGRGPLREWQFARDPDGVFEGVLDVFGDETLWAIHAPGHTPGSTAYVARTPNGPVLFTGDVSHTVWGWDHDVEPGEFTLDHARNVASLRALRALAARHPGMDVRFGYQRRAP